MRAHGTRARYVHGPNENDATGIPCRCDPCTDANRAAFAAAKRRTEPPYVSAVAARKHVAWLSTQGVGLKTIVKTSGVSTGLLWRLMYGKGGRPSRRIRRDTETRILAVTPSAAAAGARVPSGPTRDAIAELCRRGWTKAAIARAIGNPEANALQVGQRATVLAGHAEAIAALADQPVPARTTSRGTIYQPVPKAPARPAPSRRVIAARRAADIDRFHTAMADLLEARIDQAIWRRRAACTTVPKHLFFPGKGDTATTRAAKAVCSTCPVAGECLEANLDQKQGIWGGTSPKQRKRLRAKQPSGEAAA